MDHPSHAADTDPVIGAIIVERWRSMSTSERVDLVGCLCADVELLARAGIAATDPRVDEVGIRYELARRRYGHELADAAYRSTPAA